MSDVPRTAVLLDRHPLWLEAVDHVLSRLDVLILGKTTSSTSALQLLEHHKPQIFITGITMRDGEPDGLACIRRARERVPHLRAVVLSMSDDPAHIEDALAAGAVAYVLKSAHPDDLASAVRQAFDHSVYFAGAHQVPATHPGTPSLEAADLTRREREILELVAEGHSNATLAKMLWVTEQTVKFHLSNVYRKLNVKNRTEASRWAQVHGLLETKKIPV